MVTLIRPEGRFYMQQPYFEGAGCPEHSAILMHHLVRIFSGENTLKQQTVTRNNQTDDVSTTFSFNYNFKVHTASLRLDKKMRLQSHCETGIRFACRFLKLKTSASISVYCNLFSSPTKCISLFKERYAWPLTFWRAAGKGRSSDPRVLAAMASCWPGFCSHRAKNNSLWVTSGWICQSQTVTVT